MTNREFPLRRWIERFAWGALAVLFLLVFALPIPDASRLATIQFLLVVAAYVFITFRLLFPRWNYAPRLIYATLLIDLLIIGVLNLLLAEYIQEFEMMFIPLIVAAALISGWRGTLFVAGAAAVIDFVVGLRLSEPRHTLLNQLLIVGGFLVTGVVVVLLVEHIRRQTLESASAGVRAAESERRRREEAERSAHRWQAINAVGLKVQQESRPAPILETTGAALKSLGLECIVELWDEPGQTLRMEYLSIAQTVQKQLERWAGITARDFRLRIEDLPDYQQVIATQRAAFAKTSAETLRRILPNLPSNLTRKVFELTGVHHRILAPLLAGDQVIGVLRVWGGDLDETDVPAITALAAQLAVALEKTRLFSAMQKRASQLELVSAIAKEAETIYDPQELMQRVVQQIGARFGYQNVGIVLLDRANNGLFFAAGHGELAHRPHVTDRLPIETGIVGWVVRQGTSYIARDVRLDPNYEPSGADDPVRSQLCVPLRQGSEVIGALSAQSTHVDAFDECDVAAMETLASQVGVALEKANYISAERKRAAQFALVSVIAERAAGIFDVDELLNQVTHLIVQQFGYHNAGILMNDLSARAIILRARAGAPLNLVQIGYRQAWDVGLIGLAARTAQTIVVNDVQSDPRYLRISREDDACRSEMCVPLKRGDEVLGILDLQSTDPNAFGPGDVAVIEALTSQIAVAIAKAELFAAERKRAAQLALVSAIAERVAMILDPDRLLNQVAALIREQFGYFNVAVLTLDEQAQELILRANAGGLETMPGNYRQSIQVGLMGCVARAQEVIRVNDVLQDPRYYCPPEYPHTTRSELCVPLRFGDTCAGVLDIQAAQTDAFDASDVAAMETLANQIAIALENARLYARAQDDAQVKTALLRELSHRVKNNLTALAGLLYLGLDDEKTSRQEILSETLARVQSMVVAHGLLADSPRARVDLLELGQNVLDDSVRHLTLPGQPVPHRVRGEPIEISARQASSLALVLNELITNAFKHGRAGTELELTISRTPTGARIELFNDGEPLPEGFSSQSQTGVGLYLIRTLVEKDLQGHFELAARESPRGIAAVIAFTPET